MTDDQQPKRPNQIALTIPPALRQRLDTLAKKRGRTRSALLVQALQEFLDRQEKG